MFNLRTFLSLAMLLATLVVGATGAFASRTPEQTVEGYLKAMKDRKYDQAYPYLSKAMAGQKDAETWAKETKYQMETAEVKIFEYEVFPGKIDGDVAKVPNILKSQDKFLNQLGATEYELYTLIKEDGEWKIDQQEQVDKADQPKWFTKKKPS